MRFLFRPHSIITCIAALNSFALPAAVRADGIQEPGLILYGEIRNLAGGPNHRLLTGGLTLTVTPSGGTPITVTTNVTEIGGRYSYLARIPFESLPVGSSATPAPGVLRLNASNPGYTGTLRVTIGSFTTNVSLPVLAMSTAERGKVQQMDLVLRADLNANGVPDDWELAYFGSLLSGLGPDRDGDGLLDGQEFCASTNPTNAASVLGFASITCPLSGGVALSWASVTNRAYTICRAPIVTTNFVAIATNLAGTPPFNTFTDTNAPGGKTNYFYRLKVDCPQ